VASGKIAFVFPGQGSQYVGMGRDLCERFTVAQKIFAEADDALHARDRPHQIGDLRMCRHHHATAAFAAAQERTAYHYGSLF
jgi:malonyl CoA-acyl carrier protein transacylase